MTFISVLSRLKNSILPDITPNALLDALLGTPADEISSLEAKIEAWGLGASDVVDNATVSVTFGSASVTLVGGTTTGLIADDILIIAGSVFGNSGKYRIATVDNSTQLTLVLTTPFPASETGLRYGFPKSRLITNLKGLALPVSGVDSDSFMNFVSIPSHQARGTSNQIIQDFGLITATSIFSPPLTIIKDTVKPLTVSSTTATITSGGAQCNGSGFFPSAGNVFTITKSTKGSNGVYYAWDSFIRPARRAVNSQQYYAELSGGAELQFREDRTNNRIYFRLINVNGQATNRVNVSIACTGSTVTVGDPQATGLSGGESLNQSSSTFSTFGNGDNTWSVSPGQIKEGSFNVSHNSPAAIFTVTWSQTVGTIQAVRLGRAGLATRTTSGAIQTGTLSPFRFGGLIQTVFRGEVAESNITLLTGAYPGYYMGLSTPGTYENDDYTILTPIDFAVIDIDHRNYANYSETDLKVLARDYLVPVDTEYVLGFI